MRADVLTAQTRERLLKRYAVVVVVVAIAAAAAAASDNDDDDDDDDKDLFAVGLLCFYHIRFPILDI